MEMQVLQLCLANAMRDERVDAYRYGRRHARFLEMLRDMRRRARLPAVVCVKELRHCKDADGGALTPSRIAGDFAAAGSLEVAAVAPVKLVPTLGMPLYNPFYLGQLYDPAQLVHLNSFCVRYDALAFGEVPSPHVGTAVLLGHYARCNSDGTADLAHQFIVESCHMPLREDHKTAAARWFATALPSVRASLFGVGDDVPVIRIGDFNTFADKAECAGQLALLSEGFDHAGGDFVEWGGTTPLFGTFYPFPHDAVPDIVIASPLSRSPSVSVLDHVFLSRGTHRLCVACKELILDNYDAEGTRAAFDGATIPLSDHLPLLVTLAHTLAHTPGPVAAAVPT